MPGEGGEGHRRTRVMQIRDEHNRSKHRPGEHFHNFSPPAPSPPPFLTHCLPLALKAVPVFKPGECRWFSAPFQIPTTWVQPPAVQQSAYPNPVLFPYSRKSALGWRWSDLSSEMQWQGRERVKTLWGHSPPGVASVPAPSEAVLSVRAAWDKNKTWLKNTLGIAQWLEAPCFWKQWKKVPSFLWKYLFFKSERCWFVIPASSCN